VSSGASAMWRTRDATVAQAMGLEAGERALACEGCSAESGAPESRRHFRAARERWGPQGQVHCTPFHSAPTAQGSFAWCLRTDLTGHGLHSRS
jgi:hypothetical protein